jgi:spore coat polysaccharide biosynthesis protein SpsF
MSSTRLPGKSLADVCGEPMLSLVLKRLGRASLVDEVKVATSTGSEDDPIEATATELGFAVHRGPLEDVLARYVGAVAGHDGEVVRITADCPFVDPGIVDTAIAMFRETPGVDYLANVAPRTYPNGLDVEVVAPGMLARLDKEVRADAEREHVTLALRLRPEKYTTAAMPPPTDEDLTDLRWTVDTPEDLEFARRVVERLGERRYEAQLLEVLETVRREPSLADFGGSPRG